MESRVGAAGVSGIIAFRAVFSPVGFQIWSSEVEPLSGRLFPLSVKMTAGLMAVLFQGTVAAPVPALAAEPFPEVKAKAHVVMEFETGLVLMATGRTSRCPCERDQNDDRVSGVGEDPLGEIGWRTGAHQRPRRRHR